MNFRANRAGKLKLLSRSIRTYTFQILCAVLVDERVGSAIVLDRSVSVVSQKA